MPPGESNDITSYANRGSNALSLTKPHNKTGMSMQEIAGKMAEWLTMARICAFDTRQNCQLGASGQYSLYSRAKMLTCVQIIGFILVCSYSINLLLCIKLWAGQ